MPPFFSSAVVLSFQIYYLIFLLAGKGRKFQRILHTCVKHHMSRSRGISSKPKSRQNPKATSFWPCVSTNCFSIFISVQCRSTPLIIAATSEEEQVLSWE